MASLAYPCLHVGRLRHICLMQHSCLETFVENLNQPDNLLWNPLLPGDLPGHVAIYGVKGLLEIDKTKYNPVFHSRVCSTIILSVATRSQRDRFLWNPACSSRSRSSRASFILSRMILRSILLAHGRSIMPLHFLQRVKSPFLEDLARRPG